MQPRRPHGAPWRRRAHRRGRSRRRRHVRSTACRRARARRRARRLTPTSAEQRVIRPSGASWILGVVATGTSLPSDANAERLCRARRERKATFPLGRLRALARRRPCRACPSRRTAADARHRSPRRPAALRRVVIAAATASATLRRRRASALVDPRRADAVHRRRRLRPLDYFAPREGLLPRRTSAILRLPMSVTRPGVPRARPVAGP